MKPSQNLIKGKAPTQKGKGKGTKKRKKRIDQCATKRKHPKAQTRAVKEQPKC
jgi:hypothetical protein